VLALALGAASAAFAPAAAAKGSSDLESDREAAGLEPPAPRQPAPKPAESPSSAKAEIVVLHATNDHTGIDPKIGKMPELAKPPFSSYDSYKLLDKSDLSLARGEAKQKKLPDDGQLAVTLKGVTIPAKPAETPRYSVSASIQKPGGKAFLPALDVTAKRGEIFFIAGQRYKGGILVIGIRVVG
jgi:hypothetical protein